MAVSPEQYASINLPHAQTVLGRIERSLVALSGGNPVPPSLAESLDCLDRLLRPYFDDPPEEEAVSVADSAAREARRLVERIVRVGLSGDRLGQCVRNFFECLGRALDGAELSLVCGERPDSPLRT
ncbi:MAG: hypothetical protein DMG22_00620 [Acidobacteria bacterium]|nr:MAG: hypothetical protein DMG22_00620 [Acidobacteriota bacterium]